MTDALAIAGMIQSFKTMTDLGKALLGMRDAALIREKVIELNGEILSAQAGALATQADQAALLKHVHELEKEVTDLKAWNAEKQKYELTKASPYADVFAYVLKDDSGSSEPHHYICPKCYEDRIKSILQKETRIPLAEVLVCARCGADIYLSGEPSPLHAAAKKPPYRSR
jgi:superfamily II helicase